MILEIVAAQRLYEVQTDLSPSKWLAQTHRTACEDVTFIVFQRNVGYTGRTAPVLLRVDAIESIQAVCS